MAAVCLYCFSYNQVVSLAFRYGLHSDITRWLSIDKDTGSVKVNSIMDRESPYVKDSRYTVLVLAYDDGKFTLVVLLNNTVTAWFLLNSNPAACFIFHPSRRRPSHGDRYSGCDFIRCE